MTPTSPVPPRRMLLIVMGFVVWSIAFIALYATNAIGCAFDWPAGVQRSVLIALYAVHLIALAVMAFWTWRRWSSLPANARHSASLLEYLGFGLTLTALAATAFSLGPVFAVSMCL